MCSQFSGAAHLAMCFKINMVALCHLLLSNLTKMFGKDNKNTSQIGWENCNFGLEKVGKLWWIISKIEEWESSYLAIQIFIKIVNKFKFLYFLYKKFKMKEIIGSYLAIVFCLEIRFVPPKRMGAYPA